MRSRGRITVWKDDQGYGFIQPEGGGDRIFVHIKAFQAGQPRPQGDEAVEYSPGIDEQRRPCATKVVVNPGGLGGRSRLVARSITFSTGFSLAFCLLLVTAALLGKLPWMILGLYAAACAITFLIYALDKQAARQQARRVPETTLFLLGLLGGWPAAIAAQKVFHHKTRKTSFQVIFWATAALNCAVLAWLLTRAGGIVPFTVPLGGS